MGQEQGGISPAAVPLGEGPSGTPTAAPDPMSPTETWGKGGSDKDDMVWGCLGAPVQSWLLPPALLGSRSDSLWVPAAAGCVVLSQTPGQGRG